MIFILTWEILFQCVNHFSFYRVYGRESKKIKAKAIDSNTTALDEKKAEQEVRNHNPSCRLSLQSSTDSKASLYSQYCLKDCTRHA